MDSVINFIPNEMNESIFFENNSKKNSFSVQERIFDTRTPKRMMQTFYNQFLNHFECNQNE